MFQVVYLFQVKPGRNQDFERAWKELTEAFYRNAGSLGSKLVKKDEHCYLSIAHWPNPKSWEDAASIMPGWAGAIRDRMRDCCHVVETLFTGMIVEDLTRTTPYRLD